MGIERIRTARTVRNIRKRGLAGKFVARDAPRNLPNMPTAVGQLRLAQHAAQDSYQDGLSFAELPREVLLVVVGNKGGRSYDFRHDARH